MAEFFAISGQSMYELRVVDDLGEGHRLGSRVRESSDKSVADGRILASPVPFGRRKRAGGRSILEFLQRTPKSRTVWRSEGGSNPRCPLAIEPRIVPNRGALFGPKIKQQCCRDILRQRFGCG